MFQKIINYLKKYWKDGVLLAPILWLCVWGTYNTDIFRLFSDGFPHNFWDFFHEIRSFLPFLALSISLFIIINNKNFDIKFLKNPIGLLGLYTIIGLAVSVFSKDPLTSIYWGILYGTAIIVLLAIRTGPDYLKNISVVINANLIIATAISVILVIIFFAKPGIFSFSTLQQFLQGGRPYESLGNIHAEVETFGMAGSRPTGLGRYAGLVAIMMFANFWQPKKKTKIIFYILFAIFSAILIFSRARTSIIAFIISLLAISFLKAKSKYKFIFICGSIILLLFSTDFYQFSLTYLKGESLMTDAVTTAVQTSEPNNQAVITLSGRTTGIWPESWKLFLSSPLVGRGFHADRIFLNGQHAHNSLIQALIQSGIIGTLFFISAFIFSWIILYSLFKKPPQDIVLIEAVGILAFFTIRGITESTAFFGADYLFLIPVMAYLSFLSPRNGSRGFSRETFVLSSIYYIRKISYLAEDLLLWPIGKVLGPKFLEQLRPYDVEGFTEKTRIGNLHDGGYVIPLKILSLIDVEYCYGVASDVNFEEDLARRIDIPVRLYDHTVDGVIENKNFFFKKEGIAARKHGKLNTFKNHIEKNNDFNKRILLKMDIEGAEWNILEDIINNNSKNIVAIVLELHRLYQYENLPKYIKVLKTINNKFTLVHIHCNNNGKMVDFGVAKITNAIEVTFINNSLVNKKEIMSQVLPSSQDSTNIINKPDIKLDFWKNR